ncbi:dihydrodipicolinate synthase family protein [Halorubrum sp. JWXQ-INN 858]|uniref:dihydrodipicolinate synthase family protein n=1 Tax=Halorubrum sp. JWXQ-INN 858 TaxID=2690782 RepID=UPI00135C0187|nr:dihydrodipicolinate synthase family protein [Halorubrum sp. JWXQ-INN 858]MWV65853.1 dihydrodipicolinate synthase family protein [Halorubrum sp. JWXQ-INN 858]
MDFETELRGATPPLVTPFSGPDAGSVDHDALAAVVEHAVDGGVAGLFPNGTTGEFASLTAAERAAVVETTVANAAGRPVLAGVADTAVADVLDHADRAADAGADAVVVTPPYFHAESGEGGNRAFLRAVADGSPLPTFLYDIPSCTGNPLSAETVVALADHPNVAGVKDSSGDFSGFCRLLRETPDGFVLLQGFDALLLPSLRMGATGGVHALSNVVPEAFAALHRAAVGDGDGRDDGRADAVHEAIGGLFDVCLDHGFAPATKAALRARGVVDDAAVRPPLCGVDPEAIEGPLAAVTAATDRDDRR